MTQRSIFLAALDLADPAERAAYLDRACAGDAGLRRRVEELLAAHAEPGDFLEPPVVGEATAPLDDEGSAHRSAPGPIAEGPGSRIGPYKLLQKIGEGGMGVVYMAEQESPVHRKVALKIIKPGMDTRQVVARFEAERQALALMDHPNIARVLDAGTTSPPLVSQGGVFGDRSQGLLHWCRDPAS
jgi:eukaryotic-like serine/threonine-protein kinase